MRLLGVDPGGTTGWVVLQGLEILDWGELSLRRPIPEKWKMADAVVVENFRLRPAKGRVQGGSEMPAARRIEEVKEWAQACGLPLTLQEPSAKAAYPDELLRVFGLWVPSRHARDAVRHALHLWLWEKGGMETPEAQRLWKAWIEQTSALPRRRR